MKKVMTRLMAKFIKCDEGQSMVEYGLIIALVAVVVIVTLSLLGTSIGNLFANITKNL